VTESQTERNRTLVKQVNVTRLVNRKTEYPKKDLRSANDINEQKHAKYGL